MLMRFAYPINPATNAASGMLTRSAAAKRVGNDPSDFDDGLRAVGPALHLNQDQQIYSEGDEADIFFKVVSGVVRTCKFRSDGRRQIDAFYAAGDMFGFETSDKQRFSAEAVCECTVISYRRVNLWTHGRNRLLSQQLFSYAMANFARAQEHSLLLGRRSAAEKVSAFLISWAAYLRPNHTVKSGEILSLAMTRQDIADYLGLTIETVSRTLSQFERVGFIEILTARQIRLKNPAALQALNS